MLFSFQRPLRFSGAPCGLLRSTKHLEAQKNLSAERPKTTALCGTPIRLSVVSSLCSSTAFARQRVIVAPKNTSGMRPEAKNQGWRRCDNGAV
jgi:hypothetical protein